jgi:C4-dicarboxylate-specific signal transduction histidine kinase
MVGIISHQWKQPLNSILLCSSIIHSLSDEDDLQKEDIDENCTKIEKNISYMNETMTNFLDFFKPTKIRKEIDIQNTISKTLAILEYKLKAHSVKVQIHIQDDIELKTHENSLIQVLINIINNSCDALVENEIENPVVKIDVFKNNGVFITISDNAGGIKSEILDKIFEPYVSTKGENGNGIGLYMSKMIVTEKISGEIIAENKDDGAMFTLKFKGN